MTALPDTMMAWRSLRVGQDGLAFERIALPSPGPGEALLRVEAAALNFADLLMAQDRYQVRPERPFTMGQEAAGTVVAAGEGCRHPVGTRLAAILRTGGFAEYAAVRADDALVVPDGMASERAAAIPVVYMTAALALTQGTRVEAGERVLVLAAAGGVGLACVEIASALGATVIAAAGGRDKGAVALARGAAHAVDYDDETWPDDVKRIVGPTGLDVAVDNVGGDRTMQALRLLGFGGRLLVVGFASGRIPDIPANRLMLKGVSAIGVHLGGERPRPAFARAAARLSDLIAAGRIEPLVGARFPLAELPAAMEALGRRATTGKVVLLP